MEQVSRGEKLGRRRPHARWWTGATRPRPTLARFYQADVSDPTLYDLVINTATFAAPVAAELIVKAVEAVTAKR